MGLAYLNHCGKYGKGTDEMIQRHHSYFVKDTCCYAGGRPR